MLAKFTRQPDAPLPGSAEPPAPPEVPGESTRVLRLPGGKHGAGPMRFTTSSRRRTWVSRAVLFAIMCVQAALTLRMSNTAFEDEALYLYSGHLEIAHCCTARALQGNYASYFSGAPVLYPVLGALADDVGGLAAARTVSLLAMLATTGLLYSLTRRLFNERVGLCAAVIFSVTESALFLGHLATYDAPSLFLLALATWIVVRTAVVPLAGLPAGRAADRPRGGHQVRGSALFVPTIVVLGALAAWPYRGRKALIAPAALGAAVVALLGRGAVPGRPGLPDRRQIHHHGAVPGHHRHLRPAPGQPAVGRAAVRAGPDRRGGLRDPGPDRAGRADRGGRGPGLADHPGIVLTGTALLAPADQIHIHTLTSLQKHIGFGLFFAAPFAGIGLTRIIGDHFRRAQVGIAIWGAALVIGMTQANDLFDGWPDSSGFVPVLTRYLQPGARYLVEVDEVPIYYLRRHTDAQPDQFSSTYFIGYTDSQGQYLTGNAAYVAAIKAGYFRVVAYDGQVTPVAGQRHRRDPAGRSRLPARAAVPANGHTVTYYVWVRRYG